MAWFRKMVFHTWVVSSLLAGTPPQAASQSPPAAFPADASLCLVESLEDGPRSKSTLRSCLTEPRPQNQLRVVRFAVSGEIRVRAPIEIPSFTMIDGRTRPDGMGPITISAPERMFIIRQTSNIRILGLRLHLRTQDRDACLNPQRPSDLKGCGVVLLLLGARDVQISHNEFSACGNGCVAVWSDQSRGKVAGSDRVVISRNIFRNSYYGVFAGVGNSVRPEALPLQMRISVHENLFEDIFRRSPKASSGVQMHVFNNVVSNWGKKDVRCSGRFEGSAASSVGGAQMVAENNVFSPRPEPYSCRQALVAAEKIPIQGFRRDRGLIRQQNNLLLNGAMAESSDADLVFDPAQSDFFSPYALLPLEGLEVHVRTVAGPLPAVP